MRSIVLALCVVGASAFAPVRHVPALRSALYADAAPAAEEAVEEAPPAPPAPPKMSQAVPFMPCPANIQDYDCAGNYGFDPLGFTNWVKVDWLREAELKHGRICQLAVVGFAATDLGFRVYPDPNGLHQVSSIGAYDLALSYGAMQQLLLWIGMFEVISTVAVNQMINEDSGRLPGDFKLDPFNMCKDEKTTADMKLKEVVHCRLAMFAFSGMVTQAVLTQGPFPYASY